MMNERMSKEQLLCRIDQLSFAVVDISLYLNTHPCDEKALSYFEEKSTLRNEALEEYARNFGPLTIDTANETQSRCWEWVNQPWPWEVMKGGRR